MRRLASGSSSKTKKKEQLINVRAISSDINFSWLFAIHTHADEILAESDRAR